MAKWTDSLAILGKIAPSIAAAAGGPLAGSAVTAIESVFGLKPEAEPARRQDAAAAAIATASPDQLLALKKADQDFQARMTELGFQDAEALAKIGNDDRDSARKREMSVRDFTPKVLAISVTAGFFGFLLLLSLRGVPESSRDLINIMVGALGTAWAGIVAYYFGSSAGSARQTELLAKAPPVA
jgi:hypothetical protein